LRDKDHQKSSGSFWELY